MSKRSRPVYGLFTIKDGQRPRTLYDALGLLKPRGKSGAFYLVASYHSTSSASAALNAIRAGRRKIPEGEYEYKVNVRKKIGRSYLYARRVN